MTQNHDQNDRLPHLLSRAAHSQDRGLETDLRQVGLTPVTLAILLAVSQGRARHPSEIAEFVSMDRTGISRALSQLEDAGLIWREISPTDRRKTSVKLTRSGQNALISVEPITEGQLDGMSDKLSETEMAELERILRKLVGDRLSEQP